MDDETRENFFEVVRKNKQLMRLLSRVAQKIREEKERGVLLISVLNHLARAELLTGIPKGRCWDSGTTFKELHWRTVHGALDIFYVGEQKLPTTKELFDSLLYGNIPTHIDIRTFRMLLLKMGFVWKRITIQDGSQRLVIIERPKLRFERFNYLKMVNHYRSNMNFVYVSETLLHYNENTDSVEYCNLTHVNIRERITEAKQQYSYLYVLFAVTTDRIYCYKTYDQFESDTFKDWICQYVKEYEKPSVVIFTGGDYKDREIVKMPSENGLKIDMMEWLDYHSVPYDPNMSKHDLWTLVEKYTNTVDKIYQIDSVLNHHGHVVLRIPDLLKQLTPAFLVYKMIASNLSGQQFKSPSEEDWQENWSRCIVNILVTVNSKILRNFYEQIVPEEEFLLNKEKRHDLNLDRLFEKSKLATYDPMYYDSDLPSWNDDD